MSATVPEIVVAAEADGVPVANRPWPRISMGIGGNIFEWRGAAVFVRVFGMEVYVHTAEVSDWWTLREPGCFEAAMGRVRVSAARATAAHEP